MAAEDVVARRTWNLGTGPEPSAPPSKQPTGPHQPVQPPQISDHDAALVSAVLRETPALAKQLAKGGLQALWVVVILLVVSQAALAWAVIGHASDGDSYSARVDRQSKVLEWLALCEVARQNGREPPAPPLFLLQGGL